MLLFLSRSKSESEFGNLVRQLIISSSSSSSGGSSRRLFILATNPFDANKKMRKDACSFVLEMRV